MSVVALVDWICSESIWKQLSSSSSWFEIWVWLFSVRLIKWLSESTVSVWIAKGFSNFWDSSSSRGWELKVSSSLFFLLLPSRSCIGLTVTAMQLNKKDIRKCMV